MEIQNTLLNSLYRAVVRIQDGPESASPTPGTLEPRPQDAAHRGNGQVYHGNGQIQSIDGSSSEILSPEEKKLLSLLFDGLGEMDRKLYGSQAPEPEEIGNFIDLRG